MVTPWSPAAILPRLTLPRHTRTIRHMTLAGAAIVTQQGGLVLEARSLLSKWGFNDGDAPDTYLDWLDERGLPYPDDWHGLLRVLVRTRLMPHVREDVVLTAISTSHSPIRAETIDGHPIDDTAANEGFLADVAVNVPFAEVYNLQTAGITA